MNFDSIATRQGNFVTGANYWASHAGTQMWSNWEPKVVSEDMKQLSNEGLQILRVFPMWPDFQPLVSLLSSRGQFFEYNMLENSREIPLPHTPAGQAGMSQDALDNFRYMADEAHKNGLKLIVGLITGWMSGRLHTPQAFHEKNVITDPEVVRWQIRFIKHFVGEFKDHPAIDSWDLGNECNCLQGCTQSEAWTWTSHLANAIRSVDPNKPVVSGMHSLRPEKDWSWRIQDQGELTDLLTTHPYPQFTPHCNLEPVNQIRNTFHATAESRWYSDIGGKPCIAEEIGTLGPFNASDEISADYARNAMFNLWAHDCHGLIWWCAYDQDHLDYAPYSWVMLERELGLIRSNREPKPVIKALGQFREMLKSMPFEQLPQRRIDAICVQGRNSKAWENAFAAFILGKQAGLEIEFMYAGQKIKDSALYLVPGVDNSNMLNKHEWDELLARTNDGATLFITAEKNFRLAHFKEIAGLEVQTNEERLNPFVEFEFNGKNFKVPSERKYNFFPCGAEVLAKESDGNPVFTRNQYGKGVIYFLAASIEYHTTLTPQSFHGANYQGIHQIYQEVAQQQLIRKKVTAVELFITLSEHELDNGETVIIAVNNSPQEVQIKLKLNECSLGNVFYGEFDGDTANFKHNDGIVFTVK